MSALENNTKVKVIVFDLFNTLIKIDNHALFFVALYKHSHDGFGLNLRNYL